MTAKPNTNELAALGRMLLETLPDPVRSGYEALLSAKYPIKSLDALLAQAPRADANVADQRARILLGTFLRESEFPVETVADAVVRFQRRVAAPVVVASRFWGEMRRPPQDFDPQVDADFGDDPCGQAAEAVAGGTISVHDEVRLRMLRDWCRSGVGGFTPCQQRAYARAFFGWMAKDDDGPSPDFTLRRLFSQRGSEPT